METLPVIQKTYDLVKWYVPVLNKLPRDHKFALGDRLTTNLYCLLEGLIETRFSKQKVEQLRSLNVRLEIMRHQTRLLLDFELISVKRYEYASQQINAIGIELGGWMKQQREA